MVETAEIKKQYNTASYDAARAFDPASSVFVSANAGAGKTTLLTNRVLALLIAGIEPSRLLCLTYTNAGASEMANRIQRKLGKWVMCHDEDLANGMKDVLGYAPSTQQMSFARGLFARVLEAPEGIRIQTLHSFCQSLLRRFPVEAEINPHFTLMDSRSENELLKEARLRLFTRAQYDDAALRESLRFVAGNISESTLHDLFGELIAGKRRMRPALREHAGKSPIQIAFGLFDISPADRPESLVSSCFDHTPQKRAQMREIITVLNSGGPMDQKLADALAGFLEGRISLSDYYPVYLKKDGAITSKIFTNTIKKHEHDYALLLEEAASAEKANGRLRGLETAIRTTHLLSISHALFEIYNSLKQQQGLVDYDDLILAARDLLRKPGISPWVLFKLDGGIDQVLIDEAQDTSPEQWDIVEALTDDFFDGQSSATAGRSLFIVGDEKQSIYSFQGAAPRELGQKQAMFAEKIHYAARQLYPVVLNHSYRSTAEVLRVVDSVFTKPMAKNGLMFNDTPLEHKVIRHDAPGLVELWPLAQPLMDGQTVALSERAVLARTIAATIRQWLDSRIMLESRRRAIEPGDIIILVRSRGSIVDQLVRALKKQNVPVSGHDRMILNDNLAVQDLIALGQCLLLPEDSLTLAALLKSPLFNLNDDDLIELRCGQPGKTLFEQLPARPQAYALMNELRARVDYLKPYELYAYALDTLGMRSRILGRMGQEYGDAIDEFLGQALLYERSHTASMQGFLSWLGAGESEIKRDMEQTLNCVRIMTVHGAKGLQAPVVFLPNIISTSSRSKTLKWLPQTSGALPLWPDSGDNKAPQVKRVIEQDKAEAAAESRRLLYVALTRAEDRLYVCGAAKSSEAPDDSWYAMVEAGMKELAMPFETDAGTGLRLGRLPGVMDIKSENQTPYGYQESDEMDAAFLRRPAPAEPIPSEPLTPSRLLDDEPPAASPFDAAKPDSFQRGNLVHELFQFIADLPKTERKAAAAQISEPYQKLLSVAVIEESIAEVLCVLEDERFAFLFNGEALREVPIAGNVVVAGKTITVSGQIDRLCVGDEVWVIDYKSNRVSPKKTSDIPAAYLRQMALYRRLLADIYPAKTIRCALLWTTSATISLLDESQLSTYIYSITKATTEECYDPSH